MTRRWLGIVVMVGVGGMSCAPVKEPKVGGMTASEAEAVAILAVRTAERNPKLELQPFGTRATPKGEYTVSLQRKESATTAEHWKVLVRADRSAEVEPVEPTGTRPETFRAVPERLKGNGRAVTPADTFPAERGRMLPAD